MVTISRPLSPSQIAFVEDELSNNEVSSDEELYALFLAEGLSEPQARQALTYRDRYLGNIYLDGFTPLTAAAMPLRFDPHTGQFKPE